MISQDFLCLNTHGLTQSHVLLALLFGRFFKIVLFENRVWYFFGMFLFLYAFTCIYKSLYQILKTTQLNTNFKLIEFIKMAKICQILKVI